MSEIVLDFDEIFKRYMAQNQKTWAHDRSQSLGASEVFQCIRKGFFSKRGKALGFVPDEDEQSWGALERGNLIENHFVVPAVRTSMPDGLEVLFTGDDQKTMIQHRASATPDGLIVGLPKGCAVRVKGASQDVYIPDIKSDCIVLEIKSIDPRANLIHEKEVHYGQTQMQLGLFHDTTEYRPHFSIILYVDASFVDKLTPFVVEFVPDIYAEGTRRSESLWAFDDPLRFMPEGKFDGGCEHCPWKTACGEAIINGMPAAETVSDAKEIIDDISPEVQKYLDLRDAKEEVERKFEVSKEKVKEALLQHKRRKILAADWSVVWSTAKGRETYDVEAMRKAGIDVDKYKKTGMASDRLTITRTVDKEARAAARKAKNNNS